MTPQPSADRSCDCRCPVHHGSPRIVFNAAGCACVMACAAQPLAVLVQRWGCALFLHPGTGELWFVMAVPGGQWDWESANEIDDRADAFDAGRRIEALLREISSVVADSVDNSE